MTNPKPSSPELPVFHNDTLEHWRSYFETAQHLISHLDEQLRNETGSDLGDLNILIALAEAPAHTLKMAKLAQQIVFSVARLSYRVRILEERGWIAKTACPNDKRASNLQLTKLGLNILTKIGGAHHRHIEESFTSKLTHEEISALSAISQKLAHP